MILGGVIHIYEDYIEPTIKNNEAYSTANSYYNRIGLDIKKDGYSHDLYQAKQHANIFKTEPCFNDNGEIKILNKIDVITGENCKNIKDFERKNIIIGTFKIILEVAAVIMFLILLRKWCIWMFQKVN